ncbi:MAG: hypothetical protein JST51_05055 [Armatimonadetes bacterium]|nr:hypothetical protein [Armatimonadota bacterium]
MKKPVRIGLVSAFTICIAVAGIKWYKSIWLHKPLTEHAHVVTGAFDQSDANTLLSYSFPEERSQLSLDRAKVEFLIDLYKKSEPNGTVWKAWSYQASDKDQACVMDRIGTKPQSIQTYGLTFTLNRTTDGLGSFIVPTLVFGACRNANLSDQDQVPEKVRAMLATVRGLTKLAPILNEHGIKGTIDEKSLEGVRTWDDWIKFWSDRIAKNGVSIRS